MKGCEVVFDLHEDVFGLPLKIGYSIMNVFELLTKTFAFSSYAKRKVNKVFQKFFSDAKPRDKLRMKEQLMHVYLFLKR